MHENGKARVRFNGNLSESFSLNNGLKQGSVLSPCLYNIFMGAIMQYVDKEFTKQDLGVEATYTQDAIIFDHCSFDFASFRSANKRLTAALFADDLV